MRAVRHLRVRELESQDLHLRTRSGAAVRIGIAHRRVGAAPCRTRARLADPLIAYAAARRRARRPGRLGVAPAPDADHHSARDKSSTPNRLYAHVRSAMSSKGHTERAR